jgi:hypothetical protein
MVLGRGFAAADAMGRREDVLWRQCLGQHPWPRSGGGDPHVLLAEAVAEAADHGSWLHRDPSLLWLMGIW